MAGINLAGTSTSGQALDGSLNTILSEFRMLRDETGVARKCATKMSLAPHTGTAKNIVNYGRLTAYSLTDGVDMQQAQSLADTTTSYTPAEVGVQVVIARTTLSRVADPDLLRRTGRMMNNAYDLKEDADGCAQFSSFVPIVGSTATVFGIGSALAMSARLRIGNDRTNPEPAPPPHYGIFHPLQLSGLIANLAALSTTGAGTTVTSEGTYGGIRTPGSTAASDARYSKGPDAVGSLFGVEFYSDANIAVDSADDASGAIFSKEGLVYVSEFEPEMLPDESDRSLRAIELNIVGSYVWGLYRASNYGIEGQFSCVLPTS